MVRGLYTAYTGMINEQKRLDVISNNLANAATVGYKEKNVTSQAFDDVLGIKIKDASEAYMGRKIGTMSLGVKLGEVYTNHGQGSLRETENTYDLAIDGKGFFPLRVTDKDGNDSIKYTRDGSFKLTQDGFVVDVDGNRLQGESGDIVIPTDAADVTIEPDGNIYADGAFVDKLVLVDFEDYDYLSSYANNLYDAVEGAQRIDTGGMIRQGYTEQSNVNVISEMVDMITVTRAYEANQKAIQTIDGMIDQAVNNVGRV